MSEILGRSIYLFVLFVVGMLTVFSWMAPAFVERWTRRYYEGVLTLLGFKVTLERKGEGLLFWNRFVGPPVLILLLIFWRKVFA